MLYQLALGRRVPITPQDRYLLYVISKYKSPPSRAIFAYKRLRPLIQNWASGNLLDISLSGSYAKNTAVKGSTDVDLFISLYPSIIDTLTLKDIYDSLYSYLTQCSYLMPHLSLPRKQNVSIGIKYYNISIDLIPARKHSGNTNDHSLYKNKAQTWTKTNVKSHIDLIKDSDRLNEIRVIKIWRNLHCLNFPSFYLELTVLNALQYRNKGQLALNLLTALEYLQDEFSYARVEDPANSNNIISEDLSNAEKIAIFTAAKTSLSQTNLNQIIW